ncbi:MAG: L-histidine N(alpha)-methyltransferase, partial [Inquilinus sp.]|nr:L-histidine N(alpha)-methyltransferase [Inquilinus sp.]
MTAVAHELGPLQGFHDLGHGTEDFRAAVLEGLSKPQKRIAAKFFYDAEGSRLFDAICELEEYYPTRTEIGILRRQAGAIAAAIGPQATLVEFGSGSSAKIRVLLDALD